MAAFRTMLGIGVRRVLPSWLYERLRRKPEPPAGQAEFDYGQGTTEIQCGRYRIKAPEKHALIELMKRQPYRDLCVGITAKYVSAKYPEGTMVDIGANIGDTAALMATYADNDLLLVEASDYFVDFLRENVEQLPNKTDLLQLMVSTGETLSGSLHHWAGTAYFETGRSDASSVITTKRLRDIAGPDTCFVKVDTDGFDVRILMESVDWLGVVGPAVLFENQIRSQDDLDAANRLFEQLIKSGYASFIVWDDPGYHVLSTESLGALVDLNRYLLKIHNYQGPKNLYNYDVLCLHAKDRDVAAAVREYYANY